MAMVPGGRKRCVAHLNPPNPPHKPKSGTMAPNGNQSNVCPKTKAHSTAQRKVRKLLRLEQRSEHAFLAKRDAIINVQAQFFDAMRHLYTWPFRQLTFALITDARDHWAANLEEARKCAYRAETIDPNYPGQLRYDIMIEIISLETRRINEFLATFNHYQTLIHTNDINEHDPKDEEYCDQTMLSYLDQIQTNVVLSKPPRWIAEERRPPLTWYGFLSPERRPNFLEILPREQQIL